MTLVIGFGTLLIGVLLIFIYRIVGAWKEDISKVAWYRLQLQQTVQKTYLIENQLAGKQLDETLSKTVVLGDILTEKAICDWLRSSDEPLGLDLTDKYTAPQLAALIEEGHYK